MHICAMVGWQIVVRLRDCFYAAPCKIGNVRLVSFCWVIPSETVNIAAHLRRSFATAHYGAAVARIPALYWLTSQLSNINQPEAGETFTNQSGQSLFRSTDRSRQVLARAATAAAAAAADAHAAVTSRTCNYSRSHRRLPSPYQPRDRRLSRSISRNAIYLPHRWSRCEAAYVADAGRGRRNDTETETETDRDTKHRYPILCVAASAGNLD